MAQLSAEEIKKYGTADPSTSTTQSSPQSNANQFVCSECSSSHDIGDLFLWSGCGHQYGRQCVLFVIQSQLYHKELPLCSVKDCGKLLLENEAEMVLPGEALIEYIQLHSGYQMPFNQSHHGNHGNLGDDGVVDLMHHLDDEKGQNEVSLPVIGSVVFDPEDDSAEDELADDEDSDGDPLDPQPISKGMKSQPLSQGMGDFECTSCSLRHPDEERFEWSRCRHCYGRECAEILMIQSLFQREIPRCLKCKGILEWNEAEMVLPGDEMQILQEIYVLTATTQSEVLIIPMVLTLRTV